MQPVGVLVIGAGTYLITAPISPVPMGTRIGDTNYADAHIKGYIRPKITNPHIRVTHAGLSAMFTTFPPVPSIQMHGLSLTTVPYPVGALLTVHVVHVDMQLPKF